MNSEMIATRRTAVLNRLKLKEEDCWGQGLLIFAPVARKDSKGALKSRFLPLMANSGFDIGSLDRHARYSKTNINSQIIASVREWIHYGSKMTPARLKCTSSLHHRDFCQLLLSYEDEYVKISDLSFRLLERNKDKAMLRRCIEDAVSAEYIAKTLKSKKRVSAIVVNSSFKFPCC
jgi:hypothetical protein